MFKLLLAVTLLAFIGSVFGKKKCDIGEMCPIPYTKKMQIEMVNYHNKVRGTANPPASDMQKMYWDKTIAKMALEHATKCVFEHDTGKDRRFGGYINVGQNLFASSVRPNTTDPVFGWYSEKKDFTFGEKTKAVVGHYTQVMQGKATRIGCGGAYCPNNRLKYIVTCNYLRGQYDYTNPYKLGTTCGHCPSTCKNNLCDCNGKVCKNGGRLNLNTCKCKCQGLVAGPECGKVICDRKEPWYCPRYKSYCGLKSGFQVRNNCPETCGLC